MSEILIIEDDLVLAQTIGQLLDNSGMTTKICRRINSAYDYLKHHQPDIAIVDRVLPDGDGLEIAEYLKETSFKTKVLILSQKSETISRVEGLSNGADDYLAKPFASQELKLRIESLTNKTKHHQRQSLVVDSIKIYPNESLLEIDHQPKKLRKKEIQVLQCLITHHDQVVTRAQLENWLWGCKEETPTRTALDVYIKRVRQHLGKYQTRLTTVRGFGYQFKTLAN